MESKELRESITVLEEARRSLVEQREQAVKQSKAIMEKAREFTDKIDEEIEAEVNPRIDGVDVAIQSVRRRLRELESQDRDEPRKHDCAEAKRETLEKHR